MTSMLVATAFDGDMPASIIAGTVTSEVPR